MKEVQATGEELRPQKKTPIIKLKNMKFLNFKILVVIFAILDSDPHYQCGSDSTLVNN
jgi:hypothetical protein